MQPSACTDLHCTFNLAVKKVICSSMSLVWLGPVRLRDPLGRYGLSNHYAHDSFFDVLGGLRAG